MVKKTTVRKRIECFQTRCEEIRTSGIVSIAAIAHSTGNAGRSFLPSASSAAFCSASVNPPPRARS